MLNFYTAAAILNRRWPRGISQTIKPLFHLSELEEVEESLPRVESYNQSILHLDVAFSALT